MPLLRGLVWACGEDGWCLGRAKGCARRWIEERVLAFGFLAGGRGEETALTMRPTAAVVGLGCTSWAGRMHLPKTERIRLLEARHSIPIPSTPEEGCEC